MASAIDPIALSVEDREMVGSGENGKYDQSRPANQRRV
jgi:hypothetical protein